MTGHSIWQNLSSKIVLTLFSGQLLALILAEMCHIIESNDNQGDFSCKIEMHQNVIPVFLL
jgi:hypothetical protein